MISEIAAYTVSALEQLGWAVGFYFGSILLVAVALIPTVCQIVAVIADRKIMDMSCNFALQIMAFAGRVLLVAMVLVAGGALATGESLDMDAWIGIAEAMGASILVEWVRVVTQLIAGGLLLWLATTLLPLGITEYRMARMIKSMQRPYSPAKVRRIVLIVGTDMVLWPIFVIYAFHVLHLI